MDNTQPRLTSLVPELRAAIFMTINDLSDVHALALTSKCLWSTFKDVQILILKKMFFEPIHPDLHHHAIAAVKSAQLEQYNEQTLTDFLDQFFDVSTKWSSQHLSLSDARQLGRLHRPMEFFTDEFTYYALSAQITEKIPEPTGPYDPPSCNEIRRVRQSLYRFEIYCNLFRQRQGQRPLQDIKRLRSIWFQRFYAWENEQLACIRDFLTDRLAMPFKDVAKQNAKRGEDPTPFMHNTETPQNPFKEDVLSRGLDFIYRLDDAKTYEERRMVLGVVNGDDKFLFYGLKLHRPRYCGAPNVGANQYPENLRRTRIIRKDDDDGPAKAWHWANKGTETRDDYFQKKNRHLRWCGYVMWDIERLEQWRLLDRDQENYYTEDPV